MIFMLSFSHFDNDGRVVVKTSFNKIYNFNKIKVENESAVLITSSSLGVVMAYHVSEASLFSS